jgi:putative ABC transport system ATP-binding protein
MTAAAEPLYVLEGVERRYERGGSTVHALRHLDLTLDRGDLVAIEGPSGSGKSTLLQLLGALEVPTAGRVRFDGAQLDEANDRTLTELRSAAIGFVFQQFNLIPTLTALENVEIAMAPRPGSRSDRATRALQLLEQVGLADRAAHLPSRLSGGEQQRVAIARALANNPRVVLADEPTGNLDSTTASEVIDLLVSLCRDHGVTVLLVTHDDEIAARARRRIRLRSGEVVLDTDTT